MSECLLDGEMSKATVNRQAFEDWIRVTTRTCGHDFDEGKYVCHLIQMRWAAWQEAYLGNGAVMCIDCEIGRKETVECPVKEASGSEGE